MAETGEKRGEEKGSMIAGEAGYSMRGVGAEERGVQQEKFVNGACDVRRVVGGRGAGGGSSVGIMGWRGLGNGRKTMALGTIGPSSAFSSPLPPTLTTTLFTTILPSALPPAFGLVGLAGSGTSSACTGLSLPSIPGVSALDSFLVTLRFAPEPAEDAAVGEVGGDGPGSGAIREDRRDDGTLATPLDGLEKEGGEPALVPAPERLMELGREGGEPGDVGAPVLGIPASDAFLLNKSLSRERLAKRQRLSNHHAGKASAAAHLNLLPWAIEASGLPLWVIEVLYCLR
jgi:hypothetical protein